MSRDPMPQPSPLEHVFLRELVAVARLCYDRQWLPGGSGNFSLRLRPDLIWQSPRGGCKGMLQPTAFVPVALPSGAVLSPLPVEPSEEMAVHLGIYERFAGARSVVHAHTPALVAASQQGGRLTLQGHEMIKALGCRHYDEALHITLAANVRKEGMPALRAALGDYAHPAAQVVVLAGHGAYAWGSSPMAALQRLEALEFLCATRS